MSRTLPSPEGAPLLCPGASPVSSTWLQKYQGVNQDLCMCPGRRCVRGALPLLLSTATLRCRRQCGRKERKPSAVRGANAGPWKAQAWWEHRGMLMRAAGVSPGIFGWRGKGGKEAMPVPGWFSPLASIALILRTCLLNSSTGLHSLLRRNRF